MGFQRRRRWLTWLPQRICLRCVQLLKMDTQSAIGTEFFGNMRISEDGCRRIDNYDDACAPTTPLEHMPTHNSAEWWAVTFVGNTNRCWVGW